MAHKVPPDGPQCEAAPVGAPYLNRLGTTLFQSGPESTGYHNRKISLPCSTFGRSTCRCASRVEDRSAREGSKKQKNTNRNQKQLENR